MKGPNGGPDAPMKGSQQFFGLNELTLARGAQGRVIDCAYTVAGEKVADVKGDGLIVATATGSTAYALSAGGPLVAPGYSGLVVVPIAPHSLHSRALVTGPSDIVEIAMDPSSANREATMFIDGELIPIDRPIRRVIVQSGEEPTVLLRYRPNRFTAALHACSSRNRNAYSKNRLPHNGKPVSPYHAPLLVVAPSLEGQKKPRSGAFFVSHQLKRLKAWPGKPDEARAKLFHLLKSAHQSKSLGNHKNDSNTAFLQSVAETMRT